MAPTAGGRRSFEIKGVLGEGGFGTVYLAESLGDRGFRKKVAIKFASKTAAQQRSLFDEALLLSELEHDNIVRALDLVQLLGQPALVMEYVDGVSLQELLEQEREVPPAVALEVIARVADALDHGQHAIGANGRPLGMVHRDITPGNIMITTTGAVKLLDFGIAKGDIDVRFHKTTDGKPVPFTRGYRSPERARREPFGAPADIFGLGAILTVLLTRDPLGDMEAEIANVDRFLAFMGTRIDGLAEHLGGQVGAERIWRLAESMLRWDPKERPQAEDVARAANSVLSELGGSMLKTWARDTIPRIRGPARALGSDHFTGRVLSAESTGSEIITEPTLARHGPVTVEVERPGGVTTDQPVQAAQVAEQTGGLGGVTAELSVPVGPVSVEAKLENGGISVLVNPNGPGQEPARPGGSTGQPVETTSGWSRRRIAVGLGGTGGLSALLVALLKLYGGAHPPAEAATSAVEVVSPPDGPKDGPASTEPMPPIVVAQRDTTTGGHATDAADSSVTSPTAAADSSVTSPTAAPASSVTRPPPAQTRVSVASSDGAKVLYLEPSQGGTRISLLRKGSVDVPPGEYKIEANDGSTFASGVLTISQGQSLKVSCDLNHGECTAF